MDAGAAAMNAMEANRHGGQTELRPTCVEELVAETLRRDCVSDEGGARTTPRGAPTSPSSREAPPGSPRKVAERPPHGC